MNVHVTPVWYSELKKASYGGIPFGVHSGVTRSGRKQAIHEYPFRDEVWVEDLGKLARRFRMSAFLVENSLVYGGGSVIGQRDKLLKVCESPGAKTFVHPTYGIIQNVECLFLEVTERKEHGLMFELTFDFVISGKQIYPTTKQSTVDVVAQSAANLDTALKFNFVNEIPAYSGLGPNPIRSAIDTVVGTYQKAMGLVNTAAVIFRTVTSLTGNYGRFFNFGNSGYTGSNISQSAADTPASILSKNVGKVSAANKSGLSLKSVNPTDPSFPGQVGSFISSISATAANPGDQITILTVLSGYSQTVITTTSPIGVAMAGMSHATAALVRRSAISALMIAETTYQPSSQTDAQNLQTILTGVIDEEILIAGDAGQDATYSALRVLREAIVADLQARGAALPPIAVFSISSSMPALALANRIYRDPTRSDDLIGQVAPIHPAFFPAEFSALAE